MNDTQPPPPPWPGKTGNNILLAVFAFFSLTLTALLVLLGKHADPFQYIATGTAISALLIHLSRYYVRSEAWKKRLKIAGYVVLIVTATSLFVVAGRGG
jgi:hypothetical protein